MTRRWWGALIAAVVLTATIVVPNVPGRRIAGEPVAGVVAGPPSAGDCVTWMADPWPRFDRPAPQVDDVMDYPTASTGPCPDPGGGPIVGEVVSVETTASPPARISATDYLSQLAQCPIDAIAYTGSIAPVVDVGGGTSVVWAAQPEFRYTRVGPDRAQRARGQHWSACLIGADDGSPYDGRLRDVLTAGTLPPPFGACFSAPDLSTAEAVACDRPHAAELIGTARLGPRPVTRDDLRLACVAFAGRALRTADPTRGGAIDIRVATGPEPATDPVVDSFVSCLVVAPPGTSFARSLIGLADAPVPAG
ncbi:septum formation family protein [Nakamurella sp.]|uniref:septum formation family protein n=1 Tax=Nakamurella sp. TaxID=1869182 RepID=UPI003B3BBC9D